MDNCRALKSVLLSLPVMASGVICYFISHPVGPLLENVWTGLAAMCAGAALISGQCLAEKFSWLDWSAGLALLLQWLYIAIFLFEYGLEPLAGACCGFFAALVVSGLGDCAEALTGSG